MRVRVVAYAPDPLTDEITARVQDRLSLGRVDLRCPAYARWYGGFLAWADRRNGVLPDILPSEPIGAVDAVIVGAPLIGGRLAAPMRRFLAAPHRIPPVIGVYATCMRRRPAPDFDDDLAALDNGLGAPDSVILSASDFQGLHGPDPRRLTAFLDGLAPLIRIPLTPVVIPARVA